MATLPPPITATFAPISGLLPKVTVFDKNAVPGGMLTLGIPSFRLDKDVVNAEIDVLRQMGVEFRCGVEVGKDITIQQLHRLQEEEVNVQKYQERTFC